jgi:acetyltransferase
MVLVAERQAPEGESEIAGVGRVNRLPGTEDAETAILVRDSYQNRGVGTELLRRLITFGRNEKMGTLAADTLAENLEMQQICRRLGFDIRRHADDPSMVRAVLNLQQEALR